MERIRMLCDGTEMRALLLATIVGFGVAFFAALLSGKENGSAPLAAIFFAAVCGLRLTGRVTPPQALAAIAWIAALGGCVRLAALGALSLRRALARKRARRREKLRAVQYTLPERSNTYVRARLHTALQPEEEDQETPISPSERRRFAYTESLLVQLRNAALGAAERLRAEELASAFVAYMHKAEWSAEDVRSVNEICAAVVRLAAKYEV